MNKRLFWLLTLLFFAPGTFAEAQQPGKVLRIGFLDASTASGSAVPVEAFQREMSKLGWIEGKNITIEYRFADYKLERLPELATDLVRLKVDLIVVTQWQRQWQRRAPPTPPYRDYRW
jgi:putative ABC transport system substrate-binding protein